MATSDPYPQEPDYSQYPTDHDKYEANAAWKKQVSAWYERNPDGPQADPAPAPTTPPQQSPQAALDAAQKNMAPSSADSGARATIQALLDSYGLGSLTDWYWGKVTAGEPDAQIFIELRQTAEYKARFPGMADLAAKGRAISESQYIDIERRDYELGQQYGLPADYIKAHLAGWIGDEVSPDEVKARFDTYRTYLYSTPPNVRDELQRDYGLGEGDMLALIGNDKVALPIIQQQFLAANAGAAARASGYGALTRSEAEQLATSGQSYDQYAQSFDRLGQEKELFNPILGETNQDAITRDEQLGIAAGTGTAAERRLVRRAQERVAQFQGGGGFAATREGMTGLGSAAS